MNQSDHDDNFPYKLRVYKCDPVTKEGVLTPDGKVNVKWPTGFQACHGKIIVWCADPAFQGCFEMPIEEFSHAQILPIDLE